MRAALRETYGIDLTNVLAHRSMLVSDLADLVMWLPGGCAFWRSMGGPLAWSDETHMLNMVEFRLNVLYWVQTKDGSKGANQPKLNLFPPYAGMRVVEDNAMERKAAAHRRRARAREES